MRGVGGARGGGRERAFLLGVLEFVNLLLKLSNQFKSVGMSRVLSGGVRVRRLPNDRGALSFGGIGRQ